jgi:adenylyltransferase/sulfurtransferase
LDVRETIQFQICSFPHAWNIPLKFLEQYIDDIRNKAKDSTQLNLLPIYVICRRGNDSQRAVKKLVSYGFTNVWNIEGGLQSWSKNIDSNFPIY